MQAAARRQAAIGALADTVGDGQQVSLAGGQGRRRGDHPQRILVFRARPAGAGLADAQSQPHAQTRAAVTAAEPQVVRQRRFTPWRPNQASTPRLANSHRPSW